jgi:undecaprenyl-diphosphatase
MGTPAALAVGVLVGFAAVLGCAIAAGALLGVAERPDGSTGPDARVTTWMVDHRAAWVTTLADWSSRLGSTPVLAPVVVIVALGLVWRRRWVLAGFVLLAWGGSIGLYDAAKAVVHRPRPPASIQLQHAAGSSFPSGHATQSLATYAALALVAAALLPRARAPGWVLAALLTVAVGWSRVYLGMHWASDVAAGWLIGAVWLALLAWLAGRASKVQKRTPAHRLGRP